MTFDDLYGRLLKSAAEGGGLSADAADGADSRQLDCLLHPGKYGPVVRLGACGECGEQAPCVVKCLFGAIRRDEKGEVVIDSARCVGCAECIEACKSGKLTASRDVLPALEAVKSAKGPVYALVAPAFIGQFDRTVTPGRLRSAFKRIGFAGMVEVALFADILTLKEALEFDRKVLSRKDFMITSCCCPIWIAMIRKIYRQLIPYVPGSVSPMVACGRVIKRLEPDAVTIFIGPCVAKKAEAREPDIKDAVDFVLTFEEVRDIFDAFHVNPGLLEDDPRDHSSKAGRIYARTGGVSQAVASTLERISPVREIPLKARQADGVPACKEMLLNLREGRAEANFLEGMGCVGGCVGGPKAIADRETGRQNVDGYGALAVHDTPAENPFVLKLLKRLGLESVERLLEDTDIFTRHF